MRQDRRAARGGTKGIGRLERLRRMETEAVIRGMMCAFALAFLAGALLAPDLPRIFTGFARICTSPAQLTKDYFKPGLGSVSGAMLNAALVGAACCALTFLPGARVTGATVLGYFLTTGFCFYGLNLLNILPLMLGVALYSFVKREPLGRSLNFFMFVTAIAPLISEVLFRYPGDAEVHAAAPQGVILALAIGIVAGWAMPALCAHSPAFHKGYDLYNAGPAAGFLCMLLYALLYRCRGLTPPAIGADLGEGERAFANAFCCACFGLCAAAGFALNGFSPGDYPKLFADSGYKSDFTAKYSAGSNLINAGVYGLFIVLYYNLIGATFTGATMGAVFCMLCCCMNGATPRNVLPIMIGYAVMGLLHRAGVTAFAVNAQAIVVGLCFASGLAPIAGEYGFIPGVAAGMLHYCLVTSAPVIHGGFNLYNGGFTAGIVCFLYVPVLERCLGRRGSGE